MSSRRGEALRRRRELGELLVRPRQRVGVVAAGSMVWALTASADDDESSSASTVVRSATVSAGRPSAPALDDIRAELEQLEQLEQQLSDAVDDLGQDATGDLEDELARLADQIRTVVDDIGTELATTPKGG